MSSLAAKYDYLEKLTSKVCHSQTEEPKKRAYVPYRGGGGGGDGGDDDGGPAKKKQKKKQKSNKANGLNTDSRKPSEPIQKSAKKQKGTVTQKTPQTRVQNGKQVHMQQKPEGAKTEEFNAVDILRKRLHQRIEESRGQGPPKDPSSEQVQKRRAKRKQERERKKRKRKEFCMKTLAQSASAETEEERKTAEAPQPLDSSSAAAPGKKDTSSIVFNRVEVGEEYVDKGTKLKEKKIRKVKGALTPLTGRNYKQLLSRVEARKARLEELRDKDETKAKKEEEKMRWTNVLYKAEGMKIKDDEQLLRASLKRKEKRKAQRKKQWVERSQQVVEKMQKRQDKRRRNIQRRKDSKMEKRKQRAKKKGRVLPEDLKRATV